MTPTSCPHCNSSIRQTRADGRCVLCGQLLPDALRAPPRPGAWFVSDPRSVPILDLGERAPTLARSRYQPTSPAPGTECPPDRLAPTSGIEHTVPWPVPIRPTAHFTSFWGSGDGITQPFVLAGDGAMRIVIESGLLVLHVLCADGHEMGGQTTMAGPGLALDCIPVGGTFALGIRATARWGITVIHYPSADVGAPVSEPTAPSPDPPAEPRKRWWQFW